MSKKARLPEEWKRGVAHFLKEPKGNSQSSQGGAEVPSIICLGY